MIADERMTRMMNIREVRDTLGLSYAEVTALVKSGTLRAYRYAGSGPIRRDEVTTYTRGLRFRESDIEEMLESTLVN